MVVSVPMETPGDLAALVRSARREQGLTQAGLAETAGVARAWLVRLEQGAPGAELGRVMRVFVALGLALAAVENPRPVDPDLADLYETGALFGDG